MDAHRRKDLSTSTEESTSSPAVRQPRDERSESPLPELIVEREKKRRHDHSKRYYDRLEVKMKKYYKILFYGADTDLGSSVSEDSASAADVRSPRAEDSRADLGNVDKDGRSTLHIPTDYEHDAPVHIIQYQITNYAIEGELPHEDGEEEELSDKEGVEVSDEEGVEKERSDTLHGTPASSAHSSNNGAVDLNVSAETSREYGVSKKTTTSNANPQMFTVKSMIHATEEQFLKEPEVTGVGKLSSMKHMSFQGRACSEKYEFLSSKEARISLEEENNSNCTIKESAPMDVSPESFQPFLHVSKPVREVSPVVPFNRPNQELLKIPAKKKTNDGKKPIPEENSCTVQNKNTDDMNVDKYRTNNSVVEDIRVQADDPNTRDVDS